MQGCLETANNPHGKICIVSTLGGISVLCQWACDLAIESKEFSAVDPLSET